jgi:hypothetical protein
MEALREIHEVHLNSITVHLPNQFSKQVEVIVLPVAETSNWCHTNPWQTANQIYEQLKSTGRTFSDSTDLVREDRGW